MEKLKFLNSLEELNNLKKFDLIGEGKLFETIKVEFKNKLNENSNIKVITSLKYLKNFIDKKVEIYVFKDKPTIFETKPLFLISIPKAGTHLLFELANALGYQKRDISPSVPAGGRWYFLDYYHSHTECKKFFIDKSYREPFGNRDTPFNNSPAIFIYRHPLDILVSEANYYHKKGKTSFYNYFYGMDFDERVSLLIDDKYLLGSIRDRIIKYVCWLKFPNVIPVSYEELVGESGGGKRDLQIKAIWSIMLKLEIEGEPEDIAKKIYNPNAYTFNEGKIGKYKNLLKKEHFEKIKNLDKDFLEEFGYDLDSIFSKKIEYFRNKPFFIDTIKHPPYLIERYFFDFHIIKKKNKFIGISYNQNIKLDDSTLEGLKLKILKFWIIKVKKENTLKSNKYGRNFYKSRR